MLTTKLYDYIPIDARVSEYFDTVIYLNNANWDKERLAAFFGRSVSWFEEIIRFVPGMDLRLRKMLDEGRLRGKEYEDHQLDRVRERFPVFFYTLPGSRSVSTTSFSPGSPATSALFARAQPAVPRPGGVSFARAARSLGKPWRYHARRDIDYTPHPRDL